VQWIGLSIVGPRWKSLESCSGLWRVAWNVRETELSWAVAAVVVVLTSCSLLVVWYDSCGTGSGMVDGHGAVPAGPCCQCQAVSVFLCGVCRCLASGGGVGMTTSRRQSFSQDGTAPHSVSHKVSRCAWHYSLVAHGSHTPYIGGQAADTQIKDVSQRLSVHFLDHSFPLSSLHSLSLSCSRSTLLPPST